jgi:hypothetical protein
VQLLCSYFSLEERFLPLGIADSCQSLRMFVTSLPNVIVVRIAPKKEPPTAGQTDLIL